MNFQFDGGATINLKLVFEKWGCEYSTNYWWVAGYLIESDRKKT